MQIISKWFYNSLILNILLTFFKPETFKSSFFMRLISIILNGVQAAVRGSVLFTFNNDENWEEASVSRSFIINTIKRLNPLILAVIDTVNHYIKNSSILAFALMVKQDLTDYPLMTISYMMLPSLLVATGLKAAFSSFTPSALLIRVILIFVLSTMIFMKQSLKEILLGSISGEILNKLVHIYRAREEGNDDQKRALRGKWLYPAIGVVIGIIYYILPLTTFIKLIGLLFFSIAIYINPLIGISAVFSILPLTNTKYSAALIGITFVSLILNYKKTKLSVPTAFVPAAFFLAAAAVAAVFSLMRTQSFKTFPLYVVYFMAFYCAALIFRDNKRLNIALAFLIIPAVAVSFIGIYQYVFVKVPTAIAWVDVTQFPELSTRVYATMENPNVLAEYLGLVVPVILGLLWTVKKPIIRLLLLVAASIITLCLILTFSRGAWVGFALAVMIFAVLKEPRLIFAFVIVALIAPAFMPSVVMKRIASIGSLEESSNAFRVSIWIAALRMIKDYWLTGVGLGLDAFARVYRDYMIAGTPAVHSHNLYLEIGIEMGIVGIVSFLWFIQTGISKAVRTAQRNSASSAMLVGMIGALAGHLLHGLFDYVWYSPRIVMLFWLIFGMMAALLTENEVQEGENT